MFKYHLTRIPGQWLLSILGNCFEDYHQIKHFTWLNLTLINVNTLFYP